MAPNHLARRFGVAEIVGADRIWAGDITYMPTREGWQYRAVLLDLNPRVVVGWAMQPTVGGTLTRAALAMAVARRRPRAGVLHHIARGVQYAATAYQGLLQTHRMVASMSRRGNCYDNAVVESFFATLEWELLAGVDWLTRAAARHVVCEYIEVWCNRQRRHSSLGYVSLIKYERLLTASAAAG